MSQKSWKFVGKNVYEPCMLALALYNDNGPFTATPAADLIWKNYQSGFLPITDSSGNQLTVPIYNRYIGRPLVNANSLAFASMQDPWLQLA